MPTSVEDLRGLQLWRAVVAEFLGTTLLVFIGCGSCITMATDEQLANGTGARPTIVQISLCFGLAVATVVWAIAHVSGGHVNPAVTAGLLAARRISLVRAVLYIGAQMAGAVLGAALLMAVTPAAHVGNLGSTVPAASLNEGQAVGLELALGFVLVFVVFASTDSKRTDLEGSKPLAIGLTVTACHLFAVPYTGSSMNSARSFGPAAVTKTFDQHWIYWIGPIIGGILAGLMYEHVFAMNASLTKAKGCLLNSRYESDEFKPIPKRVHVIEETAIDEDTQCSGETSDCVVVFDKERRRDETNEKRKDFLGKC